MTVIIIIVIIFNSNLSLFYIPFKLVLRSVLFGWDTHIHMQMCARTHGHTKQTVSWSYFCIYVYMIRFIRFVQRHTICRFVYLSVCLRDCLPEYVIVCCCGQLSSPTLHSSLSHSHLLVLFHVPELWVNSIICCWYRRLFFVRRFCIHIYWTAF